MHSQSSLSPSAAGASSLGAARVVPGLLALAFGLALFLGTGFAAPSMIHNATHDTRHAFGLPCH